MEALANMLTQIEGQKTKTSVADVRGEVRVYALADRPRRRRGRNTK